MLLQLDYAKAQAEKNKVGRNMGGNVRALGELGEQLVAQLVGAKRSDNRWNESADMLDRDGKHVEVKTQNRYRRYHKTTDSDRDIFSVRWAPEGEKHHTNLQKCLTVDRLIFVEYRPLLHVPPWNRPYDTSYHDVLQVWECTDRKTDAGRYQASQGFMYSWPIDLMTLLWVEHNPAAAIQFRHYSSAGQNEMQ